MTSPSQTVMLFEVLNCANFAIVISENLSPAGWGMSNLPYNTINGGNVASSGTCATCLKYATGVLANATPIGEPSPDGNPADITGNNSFYAGAYGRHQNGSNYLMCDCHAKWFNGGVVGSGQDIPVSQPASCPPVLNYGAPKVGCQVNASSQPFD